ncbi:MAG TPA: PPC domain-containing protein [Kofleriaceae bacterium]
MRTLPATRLAIPVLLLIGCSDPLEVTPLYNPANGRVVIQTNEDISDKQLYVQVRRGHFGVLDCKKMATSIEKIEDNSGERIDGPFVDQGLTKPFYDGPQWLNPTPAMLEQIKLGTDSIIDVCLMDGSDVVKQIERDLFRAWDDARKQGLGGKADDESTGEQRINSPVAYGERCVGELGEIPFFEKTGEGEYSTYDCLESTEIPLEVTNADGTVTKPREGTVSKCDNPQYIYDLCEAGPRVASRTNEQGTRWVLLCRKSIGGYASNKYNDIAMIGHNPFTGKTCFFQNALYSKTDGGKVPHPADKEKSDNLWSGVHGGVGSGIQCATCHDADPFIHTPWIDGAKDAQGRPVIPKMGIDADLALGANDTPYSIINSKGQGWTYEKQLVSSEASACLKCHRMGSGRWTESWITRLDGTDTSWNNITTPKFNEAAHRYWMPPDQVFDTDAQWTASPFAAALNFIKGCGDNMSNPACIWKEIPTKLAGDEAGGALRNPVSLPDDELAKQATTLLGVNKNAPSQLCAECHAPNQTKLRDWQMLTDSAMQSCLKNTTDGGEPTVDKKSDVSVGKDEFKTWGPFEVALGGKIEVKMAGTGDADLYVKRNAEPTLESYDCRPFSREPNENCVGTQFNANGPAKFYVGVNGFADSSKVTITITYSKPDANTPDPKEIVDCLRLEPGRADSPYVPYKAGIYAAASHLGFFQAVFKAAFPADEGSNNADTWALEYGKFKNRVSMPKGNHPRLTQGELDIVAEWFARGLPRLTTYIAPDTGPTTCTQSITSGVQQHVTAMSSQGWQAVNRSANVRMQGCGTTSNPRECLTSSPDANSKTYGSGWATGGRTLRVIRELSFNTYYWMRSSADGRFVANGATGGDGAVISDLQTGKDMRVQAAYDPGFFPDNRGWMFQGTPIGSGFCTTGLLVRNPDRIDFSEGECSSVEGISLYQHLGAALGGGDYFAVNSQNTSDNASGVVTRDPSSAFSATAQMRFTAMMHDGTRYVGRPTVSQASPYEGDSVLSPSTKLVINRIGNENEHLGYVLRRLDATRSGSSYTVSTPEIARYCVKGAKPSISYDEKWMVTHHYVGPNDWAEYGYSSAQDPTFQQMLAKGTANIILVNLLTGARTRITTMKPGQYALFPHWRSDGWIYFLVRDKNTSKEYAVASDAAIP